MYRYATDVDTPLMLPLQCSEVTFHTNRSAPFAWVTSFGARSALSCRNVLERVDESFVNCMFVRAAQSRPEQGNTDHEFATLKPPVGLLILTEGSKSDA